MKFRLKIITSLLLFAGLFCDLSAQKNMIFRFKAEGTAGLELRSNKLQAGTEVALELPLYGDKNWHYTYNFPSVGFAIGGTSTLPENQNDNYGVALYTYPYILCPLIHTRRVALNLKLGAGVGGYPITSYNHYIGYDGVDYTRRVFPFVGILNGGLGMDIYLGKLYGNPWTQWTISFGADIKALHNFEISASSDNKAFASGMLGLKYTPNVYPLPIKHRAKRVDRVLALEVGGLAGINQPSPCDMNKYYLNASINGGLYYPFTNAYRLGAGADVFFNDKYDGKQRIINRKYNFITEDKLINRFRAGLFLANDLTIERFVVGVHVGAYVFNPTKLPDGAEEGMENLLYAKVVTKYKITDRFYVQAQLKTHFSELFDCFETGFGWAMPDFGRRVKNPFARLSFRSDDHNELRID